jgi:hypothetical protein
MANIGDEFKPGEDVPHSGIYTVVHDPYHAEPHDVTCVYGKTFPPCRGCKHPRFVLKYAAVHVRSHDLFRHTSLADAVKAAAIREVHKYR